MHKLRVVALISAHNEGDVIKHVIGDLVGQGIEVYLIDHCSTDDTIEQASEWLGKGLLHIERFPDDSGYPAQNREQYIWTDILKRKEELAASLGADWYIHHDADEFREGPFPCLSLRASITVANFLGFNAIDFSLLNFRPTDDNFKKGDDVRRHLTYFEWGETFNILQIKAWKNSGRPVDLTTWGGHSVLFEKRRVFPLKFILRHYPIRSQRHGEEKVNRYRKERFNAEERNKGWHFQYDGMAAGYNFLHDPRQLEQYHPGKARMMVLLFRIRNFFRLLMRKLGPKSLIPK